MVYSIIKEDGKYFLKPFTDKFDIPKKTYGGLTELMYRFWTTFVVSNKSLGLMFTGGAGSGKTTLAEMISNLAMINKFNVVLVTDINADIELVKFIDELSNSIIILDEFIKNFGSLQDKMLTMLNDLSNRKKMFIITENDEDAISRYIRNRPGRVRYHVSFRRIKKNVIDEYCKDYNVDFESDFYIKLVKAHEKAITFAFDHLQALVTEHKRYPDDSFEDLLEILNLEILTKDEYVSIESIYDISNPNEKKLMELNEIPRIEKKNFDNGRNLWFYPKEGRGGSIPICCNDVIKVEEDRYVCLVQNKYEVILNIN